MCTPWWPAARWIRPAGGSRRGFLFPVKALSKVFRAKFMAAFETRRVAGPLRDDAALRGQSWRELKQQLYRHDWVVYAKQPLGGPAQVLEYLGRYTHRVAISNERLLEVGAERVRLRVIELPSDVFIARFLQHVLPTGYKRIRHYGLLGPAAKAAGLAAARAALDAPPPPPSAPESVEAFMRRVAKVEWGRCPRCGTGTFVVVEVIVAVHAQPWPSRGPP